MASWAPSRSRRARIGPGKRWCGRNGGLTAGTARVRARPDDFALGLATLIDGGIVAGLALVVVGLALGARGVVAFVAFVRDARDLRSAERSPLADDPAFGRRFRRSGAVALLAAVLPFFACGMLMVGAYQLTVREEMTAGGTVGTLLLAAFFAGVPGLLGGRVLAASLNVMRGQPDDALVIVFLNRVVLVFGGLAAWGAIANKPNSAWPVVAGVGLTAVVISLGVNAVLKHLVRQVAAVSKQRAEARAGTGAPPTVPR